MGYLGIDLGTTNSVGVVYNDKTDTMEYIKIDGLDEILPSVVAYIDDEILVGNEAKSGAIIYPENTIMSVKRLMGNKEKINIDGLEKTPEEISSEILKKIKYEAEKETGEIFNEVVITHPAYFNDRQIFATKQAGNIAGFKDVFLLSEPLSSAIEYGYKQSYAQTILVYDLGGGTLDVCVLEVSKNQDEQEVFQELSDVGDMDLGGDDFDSELVRWMKNKFKEINIIDLDEIESIQRISVLQRLKQEAEQIKKKLSSTNKVSIKINPLMIHEGVPKNLNLEITREEFENLIRKYVDTSREVIEEALKRANKKPEDISKVILVGGSTLIPMVKRMIAGYIKEPYSATDPAKSVAMGAAIYNYLIHLPNSNVKVGQITRKILGTEAIINIATMETSLIEIIPMGTAIPCKISDSKFSSMSGSSKVNVDLFQWEQGYEEDKKYIGSLILEGLSGATQLEITYAINKNNIFEVYLKDLKNGYMKKAEFDRDNPNPIIEQELNNSVISEKINVLFIIDTTGSMDTYINGVKDRAIEFSEILSSKGDKCKLGLIGFGDLYEKEKPSVYNYTSDIEKFKNQVQNIPRTYGGDIPESSLDALETGVELVNSTKEDKETRNIFILITDAPPHVPTKNGKSVEQICDMLIENEITTYVVARKDMDSIENYNPITRNNGKYYDLNDRFFDILDNIAVSITQLVRL